ncbi:MAG: hypothetical protein ACHQX1_03510, partial [Candidatus Micrarchaeales archaeon]
ILVVIYASLTFSYAEEANSFLPVSGFVSSIAASNQTFILVNSTLVGDNLTQQCVAALVSTIRSYNKTVYTINEGASGTCTLPYNKSVQGNACLNAIYASNKPTIIINPGTNSSIVYKGLYGDTLYVSGRVAQGNACLLDGVARVVG